MLPQPVRPTDLASSSLPCSTSQYGVSGRNSMARAASRGTRESACAADRHSEKKWPVCGGAGFNRKKIGPKKELEFGFEIPYTDEKKLKI